jgi:hypothetical protein
MEAAAEANRFSGVVLVTCDGRVALEHAFGLRTAASAHR